MMLPENINYTKLKEIYAISLLWAGTFVVFRGAIFRKRSADFTNRVVRMHLIPGFIS